MITLTSRAVDKLKEFAENEGVEASVRFKVLGSGCAGFSHDMEFDSQISETDEVFTIDGVQVLVDMLSYQYLEGVEVDFVEEVLGAGFKFINPNIKSTCGCGSSFSV